MKINIIAQLIDNKLIKIATFFRNSDANVLAWHPNEKPFMSKKKKISFGRIVLSTGFHLMENFNFKI